MKKFISNTILKKFLIILITIVMVSNFVIPNTVQAGFLEDVVNGLFYLLAKLGDICIIGMQNIMVGTSKINFGTDDNPKYYITYSPGIIFANEVLPLDINFINPDKTIRQRQKLVDDKELLDEKFEFVETKNWEEDSSENFPNGERVFVGKWDSLTDSLGGKLADDCTIIIKSNNTIYRIRENISYILGIEVDHEMDIYKIEIEDINSILKEGGFYDEGTMKSIDGEIYTDNETKYYISYIWTTSSSITYELKVDCYNGTYKETRYGKPSGDTISSTANQLRTGISTWYNALRTIALVGLLSVLVYIGIRIILSSASAQNQAKYKTMLKDWFVALCILFVLHYVMTFLLNSIDILNNIIKDSIIQTNNVGTYDELMSTVRNNIGASFKNAVNNEGSAGYSIMYLALVIITGIFTFQYLKRVVYMAFLTMIAPMIALTYPLDKIKDGKAQAFNYWLKEYIFNCLIQPVHLLIYAVLLANAMDFAVNNVLYGIVALAFMVPSEKFIKEMFGLKSQGPSGALNAAAGGAVVMSMINKMKNIGGKGKSEKEGNNSESPQVRTANKPSAGTTGGTTGGGSTSGSSTGGSSTGGGSTGGSSTGGGSTGGSSTGAGTSSGGTTGVGTTGGDSTSYPSRRGAKIIRGANKIGSGAGRFTRTVGGGALGLLAGGAALAANIADGDLFNDPRKAFTEIGASTAVGYTAGRNLTSKAAGKIGQVKDWGVKKALGTEKYNKRQFDKKFYASEGYKLIKEDSTIKGIYGKNVEGATQTYLNAGISDAGKIREALINQVPADKYSEFSKAGITSVKDMAALNNAGIGADTYKAFEDAGIKGSKKIIQSMRKITDKSLGAEEVARRASLAENLKKQGITKESAIIGYFRKKGLEESDAKEIYKQIKDLL